MTETIKLAEKRLRRYCHLYYLECEESFNFGDAERKEQEQLKQQILSHEEIVEYVTEFAEKPFNPATFLIKLRELLATKEVSNN